MTVAEVEALGLPLFERKKSERLGADGKGIREEYWQSNYDLPNVPKRIYFENGIVIRSKILSHSKKS